MIVPTEQRLEGAIYETRLGVQITVRHCRGMAEFDMCVELQRQVWGLSDLEICPRKTFLLAQQLGGQVIGAFDASGRMAGFAMAMAALGAPSASDLAPQAFLHSHMLAVLPEFQNQGLGARLKLVQREDALARGLKRMTWTFDPLAAKNAYFNLHRLGAVARRYSPDFYGVSSSRLQAGLPTDRLHAEWWLQSAHVASCVRAIVDSGGEHNLVPSAWHTPEITVGQRILLPAELEQWKQEEAGLGKAKTLQAKNQVLFLNAFGEGQVVTDFSQDAQGAGVYHLAAWHSIQSLLSRNAL